MDIKYTGATGKGEVGEVLVEVESDSRGNIIRREPQTIQDQMALEAAKKGEGEILIPAENIGNPKFPNHDKYELKIESESGKQSVIHYMKDKETSEISDIKFKKHSNGLNNHGEGSRVLTSEEKQQNK